MKDEKSKKYTYDYPRPAMTADCVIFGFDGETLRLLLIERGIEPYKGYWALPGGFMKMDETIEECARRELLEETGIERIYLEQCHTFSSTTRDPRGRVVTVAFIALVRPKDYRVVGGDDAARAAWFNASELPPLAFDHREIIAFARNYLKEVLRLRPVAFQLLDELFTIDELRRVYEVINETQYDRRNFERKALQTKWVSEAPAEQVDSVIAAATRNRRGRIARFFSFNQSMNMDNDEDKDNFEDHDFPEGSIKDLFSF